MLQAVCGVLYPQPAAASTAPKIARIHWLIHLNGGFQIDRFPLALHDSIAYLRRRLLQFRLLVSVVNLFHADAAMCSVLRLEAGVQALVSDALAVAIARKLIDHPRNLRGQLIGM